MSQVGEPFALGPDAGKPIWFGNSLMITKITGAQTGGAFALYENLLPAGFAAPLHLHHREEEPWYVLEGEIRFRCGDQVWEARPGSFIFLPRGVPHGFEVSAAGPARMLCLTLPAGFEQFVEEYGEVAPEAVLPPPRERDVTRLRALAAAHGIEILGPTWKP